MIFEEVAADSVYVGGVSHGKFVRFKLEHMARTLPGPVVREWWVKAVDQLIAPYVRDRGYDWEVTIDEVPADLWSLREKFLSPSNPTPKNAGSKRTRPFRIPCRKSCRSVPFSRRASRKSPPAEGGPGKIDARRRSDGRAAPTTCRCSNLH